MEKKKRNQGGHAARSAYFACATCGYSLTQPIKWTKVMHPFCVNPSCARRLQPLVRKGKLTKDQLTAVELVSYEKYAAQNRERTVFDVLFQLAEDRELLSRFTPEERIEYDNQMAAPETIRLDSSSAIQQIYSWRFEESGNK